MSEKDSEQTMSQHSFIGIDVSKEHLDVALLPSTTQRRVTNDAAGIAELAQWLGQSEPELIVLEATGGYESACVAELARADLPVVVVNPRARARLCQSHPAVLRGQDRPD